MNNFTSDLIVKSYSDREWQSMEDFFFYFDEADKAKGIVVPAGFISDFASVPRWLWSIYPPTGRYTKAAFLHDFLYKTYLPEFTRKDCDVYFLKAMAALKVRKITRNNMYYGVRVFGGKYFNG